MYRPLALLALIFCLAHWLHGKQQHGQFRQVDEHFLDFLLANARDRFVPDPAKLDNVVFAHIHESDKAEYAAWPPLPIDYQMMLQALSAHAPSVLVIAAPLSWSEPAPPFISELAQNLLPLPRVIVGIDITTAKDTVAEGPALQRLPALQNVHDAQQLLPLASEVRTAPAPEIAAQVELGCHNSTEPEPVALAYRLAQRSVPSLALQALTAATRTPFSQQRLSTGPGAGLHLGEGVFVPLGPRATLPLAAKESPRVPSLNALDLLTPTIADDTGSELAKTLGTGKLIVLGLDSAAPQAQAIAEALALPRLREWPAWQQAIAWAIATLLGLHLLYRPKAKVLSRMLLLLFLALTTSYLAFQSNLTWCPPAIPALIIAVSGLFARITNP